MLRKLLCYVRGHTWEEYSGGTKRRCVHCPRVEWVFGNRSPDIGEPKYEWKRMHL